MSVISNNRLEIETQWKGDLTAFRTKYDETKKAIRGNVQGQDGEKQVTKHLNEFAIKKMSELKQNFPILADLSSRRYEYSGGDPLHDFLNLQTTLELDATPPSSQSSSSSSESVSKWPELVVFNEKIQKITKQIAIVEAYLKETPHIEESNIESHQPVMELFLDLLILSEEIKTVHFDIKGGDESRIDAMDEYMDKTYLPLTEFEGQSHFVSQLFNKIGVVYVDPALRSAKFYSGLVKSIGYKETLNVILAEVNHSR